MNGGRIKNLHRQPRSQPRDSPGRCAPRPAGCPLRAPNRHSDVVGTGPIIAAIIERLPARYSTFRKALFFLWLLVRETRTLLHKLRRHSRQR